MDTSPSLANLCQGVVKLALDISANNSYAGELIAYASHGTQLLSKSKGCQGYIAYSKRTEMVSVVGTMNNTSDVLKSMIRILRELYKC